MSEALGASSTLFLLGAYHAINPGMGWLFAVARGMQEHRARAVAWSLPPIALGHADPHGGILPRDRGGGVARLSEIRPGNASPVVVQSRPDLGYRISSNRFCSATSLNSNLVSKMGASPKRPNALVRRQLQ